MNKQEYIKALATLNLPKSEYIILSGGSLLMRGLRAASSDLDLCVSKRLAQQINLHQAPKDRYGYFRPFPNCQVIEGFEHFGFDIIDGYQCETLPDVLAFKKSLRRPKDLQDIKLIEQHLSINHTSLH